MFESSDFMELFVIIAVTAMLIYKFYLTLGEKRGFEGPSSINAIFDKASEAVDMNRPEIVAEELSNVPEALQLRYQEIRQIDPKFSLTGFINGASQAFEVILQGYAEGDRNKFNYLLSDKIYTDFDNALIERDKKKQKLSTTLVKLNPVIVEDIVVNETIVDITLKFTSEQTNIIYDHDNNIIEGSTNQIEEVVDVWTFRRDARSSNPNWLLVETGV